MHAFQRSQRPARALRVRKLCLEKLEERVVLNSTAVWINPDAGDLIDPHSWESSAGAAVPGGNDDILTASAAGSMVGPQPLSATNTPLALDDGQTNFQGGGTFTYGAGSDGPVFRNFGLFLKVAPATASDSTASTSVYAELNDPETVNTSEIGAGTLLGTGAIDDDALIADTAAESLAIDDNGEQEIDGDLLLSPGGDFVPLFIGSRASLDGLVIDDTDAGVSVFGPSLPVDYGFDGDLGDDMFFTDDYYASDAWVNDLYWDDVYWDDVYLDDVYWDDLYWDDVFFDDLYLGDFVNFIDDASVPDSGALAATALLQADDVLDALAPQALQAQIDSQETLPTAEQAGIERGSNAGVSLASYVLRLGTASGNDRIADKLLEASPDNPQALDVIDLRLSVDTLTGSDIAGSLLTGARPRARLIPQTDARVAPVATLLSTDTPDQATLDSSVSDDRLRRSLINPLDDGLPAPTHHGSDQEAHRPELAVADPVLVAGDVEKGEETPRARGWIIWTSLALAAAVQVAVRRLSGARHSGSSRGGMHVSE